MKIFLIACLAILTSGTGYGQSIHILSPKDMTFITKVDERFQSYNVEMAEVIGGNFWKPYSKQTANSNISSAANTSDKKKFEIGGQDTTMYEKRSPIDLYNGRLRRLAAALGPVYMRVSGTWANTVFFQDDNSNSIKSPPKGFKGVLTEKQWKGVVDFSHAVNAAIMTSFAISQGVRNADGIWTSDQARLLVAYSKSIGGNIAAAELFNEPTIASMGGAPAGYDAQTYAKDIAAFREFAKAVIPDMLIVGPGSAGEGMNLIPPSIPMLHSKDLLSASPPPQFDVFSYHYYGAVSQRCEAMGKDLGTTPEAALSEAWFTQTDTVFKYYEVLRDQYDPGKPIWVTETADAACGGNPWAPSFLDVFRYLDQMGRLSRDGVKVIFHNTLASSEYGLIDQSTLLPRPKYWATILWHKLMGDIVLDPGESQPGLHIYAHNMTNHPGGVTLLLINTSKMQNVSIKLPTAAERYTLSARNLDGILVQLNGHTLKLGNKGELPELRGMNIQPGIVELPPASITFLTIPDAGNSNCH